MEISFEQLLKGGDVRNRVVLYKYIRLKNYISNVYETFIPITGTFFDNRFLSIPKQISSYFNFIDVSNVSFRGVIQYNNKQYVTGIVIDNREDVTEVIMPKSNEEFNSNSIFNINDFSPLGTGQSGNIRCWSDLGTLYSELKKEFLVSSFVRRMNSEIEDMRSVSIGEGFKGLVRLKVENGVPTLYLKIQELVLKNKPTDEIVLGDSKLSGAVCSLIEKKFLESGITLNVNNSKGISWHEPTDWKELPDTKTERKNLLDKYASFPYNYAIYMWIGHKPAVADEKYMYIGMVGTNINKDHGLGKRIFEEQYDKDGIAKLNGVIIDKFRFSVLNNNDRYDVEDLIKTVEMQTINSFSAFIPYTHDKINPDSEPTIHAMFDGIVDETGNTYKIRLLNRDKRYHNN